MGTTQLCRVQIFPAETSFRSTFFLHMPYGALQRFLAQAAARPIADYAWHAYSTGMGGIKSTTVGRLLGWNGADHVGGQWAGPGAARMVRFVQVRSPL